MKGIRIFGCLVFFGFALSCTCEANLCSENRCLDGQVCKDGVCLPLCSLGESVCYGRCVDTKVNPDHCGSCGVSCETTVLISGAMRVGDSANDMINGLVSDSLGNVYVTGQFGGSVSFGRIKLTASNTSVFVAKITPKGKWEWAVSVQGSSVSVGRGIVIDKARNLFVVGSFQNRVVVGQTVLSSLGYNDVFVAKITPKGEWGWVVAAGGEVSTDEGQSIAIDAMGDLYITGSFQGSASFGQTQLTSFGEKDIFVSKIDSNGQWLWARAAGGPDDDEGHSIAVDALGDVYVTGFFLGEARFGELVLWDASQKAGVFVVKVSTKGEWKWSRKSGGTAYAYGQSIVVDPTGFAYLTGVFRGGHVTFGTTQLAGLGEDDIFVAKISLDGRWEWALQAGGSMVDKGHQVALDGTGSIYLTGAFSGAASFGEKRFVSDGGFDVFISKINPVGHWLWVEHLRGVSHDEGGALSVGVGGNVHVAGYFRERLHAGDIRFDNVGSQDGFVVTLQQNTQPCLAGTCQWR